MVDFVLFIICKYVNYYFMKNWVVNEFCLKFGKYEIVDVKVVKFFIKIYILKCSLFCEFWLVIDKESYFFFFVICSIGVFVCLMLFYYFEWFRFFVEIVMMW